MRRFLLDIEASSGAKLPPNFVDLHTFMLQMGVKVSPTFLLRVETPPNFEKVSAKLTSAQISKRILRNSGIGQTYLLEPPCMPLCTVYPRVTNVLTEGRGYLRVRARSRRSFTNTHVATNWMEYIWLYAAAQSSHRRPRPGSRNVRYVPLRLPAVHVWRNQSRLRQLVFENIHPTSIIYARERLVKKVLMMLKPRETGQKGPMMLKPRIRKVRPAKEGTKTGTVMDHVPGRRASSVHLQQRPRISWKDLHMFEIKSRPVVCWLNDIAAFGSGR